MAFLPRSCHDPVNANAPVHFVNLPSCFSTPIINLACYFVKIQMQFSNESSAAASWWGWPLMSCDVTIYDVITGHENAYVNNSWQSRFGAMCEVSLFFFLIMTQRLIWNITNLGHSWSQVIWPDLSQIFILTYRGQHAHFICVSTQGTRCVMR